MIEYAGRGGVFGNLLKPDATAMTDRFRREVMEPMKKAVVLMSGGMDSTTLLYDLVQSAEYEVYALAFNYKQKHDKEIRAAIRTCVDLHVPLKIVDLSALNELAPCALTSSHVPVPTGHYQDNAMRSTVVPNRNMVFIAMAAAYAISLKADTIFYGAHSGDHAIYPDCRHAFVSAMRDALSVCHYDSIVLEAPFMDGTKLEILQTGLMLGVKYENTWSCYAGREEPCGVCGACVERAEAFAALDAVDPLLTGRK